MKGLIDVKPLFVGGAFVVLTPTTADIIMKIIVSIIAIAFTLRQWYVFEKKNKKG